MAGRQQERLSSTITPYLEQSSPERMPQLPPKKKARKNVVAPASPPPPSPEVMSNSEDEEEVVVAHGFSYPGVEIIRKSGKRQIRRLEKGTLQNESEEEEVKERPVEKTQNPFVGQNQQTAKKKLDVGQTSDAKADPNPQPLKEYPVSTVVNPQADSLVTAWEKGMEIMVILMEKFHVQSEEKASFSFLPDQSAVYRKICCTWLNEERRGLLLTFTAHKSFTDLMGRFLMAYVESYAGVKHLNWESTGCAIWDHGCTREEGVLRCYHGREMIQKEQLVEMDVTSENGQRALKEQPTKTKVVQNRWGRSVVQLKNEDARCCSEDVGCGNNMFSSKSCGLFFSEGTKAQTAFKQIDAFLLAEYPQMQRGHNRILIPLRCDCLNKRDGVPHVGRQMCKMTPFALSNAEDLRADEVTEASALASIQHPCVMVFQCANPVFRNVRGTQGPNCDFKISAPDVLGALQLTRQFWKENVDAPLPKLTIPEFKWTPRLQYRNVALPTGHGDTQPEPF